MPQDAPFAPPQYTGPAYPCWRDPMLLGAFLIVALVAGYQLAMTLLRPPWLGPVSDWLLFMLAWLELLGMVIFSWWASRAHRPVALSGWLLSAALFFFAIAQTLWLVGHEFLFTGSVPVPWWSDLFFFLQFPCFFLALLLVPCAPDRGPQGLVRLRMLLDSLLLMGAAALFSWYFLLAPMYLESTLSLIGKMTDLAFPVADLGVIFILVVLFTHAKRPQAGRVALGLLIVAFILLIIGDVWFAILSLLGGYRPGDPPDVFWMPCYLLFPLAALAQYRLIRRAPVPPPRRQVRAWMGLRREDFTESFRFLLPFLVALAAAAAIEFHALYALHPIVNRLGTHLLVVVLLLLVLLRQLVVYLEHLRVRRMQEEARANELALREGNQQMKTFLGMASHELKTPMTSIIMGLQMLQRRLQRLMTSVDEAAGDAVPQLEAAQTLVTTLLQQGRRLNRLVNELLDTSRIEAGRFDQHMELTDLAALVRMTVEEQRQAALERTILLHMPAVEKVPVRADAERIGQVVTNYLTNALRYSAVVLPVEVGVQVEGQQGRVWVRDQGPGIPQSEQERLWDRFHRVPGIEAQSGSSVGLGIGLYLSKIIIEQHGGQVGVQSEPGQGSTFWFTLPLAHPSPSS
jgi:signal transduction histidine kinase